MADATSATGGTLLPASSPAPLEDVDLDAAFQSAVAAITGIDGTLVRPRWQPNPPKQPEPNVDWCALSVMDSKPDAGPAIIHDGSGLGSDINIRHEELVVLVSFYGPRSQWFAGVLRDGIGIPQNMESLKQIDIAFVECGPTRTAPELVNQQWIRRRDMSMRFRRKVTRLYSIRNIASADVHVFDDTHIDETVEVNQ
jgi:hypothetical protein